MMQSPFHSPMFNMFSGDLGVTPAPLGEDYGLRRRQHAGNQRFMPFAPYGVPGQPQSTGGYDSSGINPHGMYNGTFNQPRFPQSQPQFPQTSYPANPGGFLAQMLGHG